MAFKKGHIPWNKGKHYSDEFKKRFNLEGLKLGHGWNKGMSMLEEQKRKISKNRRGKNTGKNHHLWNGGSSKGYKKGYKNNRNYRLWREAVFKRDDYTCQDCKSNSVYITAHHIKSWAKFPELRLELSNGRTLCEKCHSLTDNYKGRNIK